MHTRRPVISIVLVAAALLIPVAARSQARVVLGVSGARQQASLPALLDPAGIVGTIAIFPVPVFDFRFSVTRLWGSRQFNETFCDNYWPDYLNCSEEPTAHTSQMTRVEAGVGLHPALGERWDAGLAMLYGRSSMHAAGHGLVSGRVEGGALTARSAGLALSVNLVHYLDHAGRFGPMLELHRLLGENPDGCVTDVYAPFCQHYAGTSVRAGMVVRLGRRPEAH